MIAALENSPGPRSSRSERLLSLRFFPIGESFTRQFRPCLLGFATQSRIRFLECSRLVGHHGLPIRALPLLRRNHVLPHDLVDRLPRGIVESKGVRDVRLEEGHRRLELQSELLQSPHLVRSQDFCEGVVLHAAGAPLAYSTTSKTTRTARSCLSILRWAAGTAAKATLSAVRWAARTTASRASLRRRTIGTSSWAPGATLWGPQFVDLLDLVLRQLQFLLDCAHSDQLAQSVAWPARRPAFSAWPARLLGEGWDDRCAKQDCDSSGARLH